ncbi:uncharacterized protein PHALS_04770 [Plasmopara halstedii]|uniref:Uncharacterized protein n=1 Tax=Plasmopara halstedii TaxID=4781 RepID=A0A0P1B1J5_PLAHL|nr:uncharacterized protein PHALS_04770 [Plasmopara halstedii]CEG47620.1 hypothetical protein PHALS_04770 [Plasmopara halstedii]|eukprot:XP_024583989.1 hypothetical protein PHALS_04770 [Plasmopara halstedii]
MGAGDHLAHTVTLRPIYQPHGYGRWRFPAYLLDCSDVMNDIRGKVQQVLKDQNAASNPGKVCEQWKRSMRRQIQALQRKLRKQNDTVLKIAQQIATRFRIN